MTIEELQAEIARLKAEVERLKAENEAVKLGNKEWRQTAIERGEMNAEDANAIGLLKAEVDRLTKDANQVDAAWSIYENGLIETPEWVKRSQVRDAISRLWNAAKEGNPSA